MAFSGKFPVKNGVKLGGVISHVLFCIYTDKLLLQLSESGFGCFIGEVFLGAVAYADDIVLLEPEQCRIFWYFVTNSPVNIMFFSMPISLSVCTLIYVLVALALVLRCPSFQLVVTILSS